MNQNLNISINLFDFQYQDSTIGKSFKLRFSLLKEKIAEEKMIRGSQPLAGYNPEEFQITEAFQCADYQSLNQSCSFSLIRKLNLDNNQSKITIVEEDKLPILVVELMVKDRTSELFAKNFETDSNGFSNIGHNMLKLKLFGQEVHQVIQVLFDEILFCSVGIALHIQTVNFDFLNTSIHKNKSKFIFV